MTFYSINLVLIFVKFVLGSPCDSDLVDDQRIYQGPQLSHQYCNIGALLFINHSTISADR